MATIDVILTHITDVKGQNAFKNFQELEKRKVHFYKSLWIQFFLLKITFAKFLMINDVDEELVPSF